VAVIALHTFFVETPLLPLACETVTVVYFIKGNNDARLFGDFDSTWYRIFIFINKALPLPLL